MSSAIESECRSPATRAQPVDDATAAAVAWLVRPDGWEDALDAALAELAQRPTRQDDARD